MIKRILILLLFSNIILAQSNEYLFDLSSINPAALAIENNSISLYYSNKLVGINSAPKHQKVIYQSYIDKNTTIGVSLISQTKDPSGSTSFSFSYAHHINLSKKTRLALGIQPEVQSVYFDATNLISGELIDEAISRELHQEILPNAASGAFLYTSKFNLGLSATNLLGNNIYNRKVGAKSPISYLTYFNYKLTLHKIEVNVGSMLNLTENYPVVSRFHLKSSYQNFTVGATLDNLNSFGIMTGFTSGKIIFYYIRSTPQEINNTISIGSNEIKIIYLLQ